LRILVVDADNGRPMAHVPVRILWGKPPEHYAPVNGYFSAKRGFVAATGDDGNVRLAVSRTMLDEQWLDFSTYNERLRYAAVAITFDHLGFSSGPSSSDFGLDGRFILEHYTSHVDEVRPVDQIERISDVEWNSLANLGDATFARFPLNAREAWRPPAAVRDWFRLRAREETRLTETMGHPHDATLSMYPWDWSALALLWRSSALLAGPVTIESDRDRWTELARAQLIGTFDRMCREPSQGLSPHETWQALQGLWWLESQTLGRPIADEHAQRRAVSWDHGIRCADADGKMIGRGPSPSTFTTRELCSAWATERAAIVDSSRSRSPPPALDLLNPNFSRRAGTCSGMANGGAFQ
jgi:hypothetical protein